MTKRDFEFIAAILAEGESAIAIAEDRQDPAESQSEYIAGGKAMLATLRVKFSEGLKDAHPRFNEDLFDVASRPIFHAERKMKILRSLGMEEN